MSQTIIIKPIEVFGNLVLLAQSERLGNRLSNRKMKPAQHLGDFIQFTILPLDLVILGEMKGAGSLTKAQDIACSTACNYTVRNGGGCYVHHEVRTAIKGAHRHLFGENEGSIHYNPMLRFSVWGDVGRLSSQGIIHVRRLVRASSAHLAYTADFQTNWTQDLKDIFLASVQTKKQLIDAIRLGWKCYISGIGALEYARALGLTLYKCPQNNRGDAVIFGCSTCPIACDGKRHVISHGLTEK